jgi:hypothetical protein
MWSVMARAIPSRSKKFSLEHYSSNCLTLYQHRFPLFDTVHHEVSSSATAWTNSHHISTSKVS